MADPFIHPNVDQLQAAIEATAVKPPAQQLEPTEYPIVPSENGDWAEYIDETGMGDAPDKPGIAIIDQSGNFYNVRFGNYDVVAGVDWVVTCLEALLNPREPVDTVLALDRSGSMGSPPPSGGGESKLDILKEAVGTFLDVWEVMSVPGDRVGVADFADDVCQYFSPGGGGALAPLSSDAGLVSDYVEGLSSGGSTSIGAAVSMSLDVLSASPRRHMILFSDGMQNINPMLADTPGGDIEILDVAPADVGDYDLVESVYGDSGFPDRPGETLESFGTHIHTIGVGLSSSPWTDLLSEVASQTDATHYETPAPEVDLQNYYISDLLESFIGATPQLLRHQHGTLTPPSAPLMDTCWLSSTARRLTIVLTWQGNPNTDQLTCILEAPDGTMVDIHSRTKVSPRRRIISFPLPAYHRGRLLSHAGRWRLHIMGKGSQPVPYQIFWIADDHRVHLAFDQIRRVFRVGQTLNLKARLLQDKKAFYAKGIQKAVVNVTAPAIDVDRFFRTYKVSPAKLQSAKRQMKWPGHYTAREVKLYVISRDQEAVARCTKNVRKRVMLESKRGDLSGAYTFRKPGIHRLTMTVEAVDRKGERVVRTLERSVLVRPELKKYVKKRTLKQTRKRTYKRKSPSVRKAKR